MGKGIVKLGEGNWAVKDGNLLAAKETNNRFKNAEFTVTRGTDATYVGKDGLIKTTPSFYNLIDYSEDFSEWTNTDITFGANGVSAGGGTNANLIQTGTAGSDQVSKLFTLSATNTTTYSVFIKRVSGAEWIDFLIVKSGFSNSLKVWFDINNGTVGSNNATGTTSFDSASIENYGNDWYRLIVTTTDSTNNTSFNIRVRTASADGSDTRVNNSSYYLWGAQLVEGTEALDYQYTNGKEGIPRIDFTNNTDGHLLLEPESTNLITYSEDFEQWTEEANIDVTNNSITSPDGTQNAAKLQLTGSSSETDGKISFAVSPSATTHTFSVFAKKGSHNYIYIWMNISGADNITRWVNLDDGSVSQSDVTTTSSGNDWWKIQFTFDATNLTGVRLEVADYGVSTGTGGDNIYVWGAQLEALSYPTSYIPTNGSTVTRDAETCTGAGEAADFNSEEGVLYAEIAALANDGNWREISLNDGSTNNAVEIRYKSTDDQFQFVVRDGGTVVVSPTRPLTNPLEFIKVAFSYKTDDFKMYINGADVATDTDGTMPSGLNNLSFDWGGTNPFYGKCKAIRVYKEALSDTDLQNLTS